MKCKDSCHVREGFASMRRASSKSNGLMDNQSNTSLGCNRHLLHNGSRPSSGYFVSSARALAKAERKETGVLLSCLASLLARRLLRSPEGPVMVLEIFFLGNGERVSSLLVISADIISRARRNFEIAPRVIYCYVYLIGTRRTVTDERVVLWPRR